MSQSSTSKKTSAPKKTELLDDTVLLDDASYFPIRELSLKTGVNSVTLRAWERRYGLLKPKRTGKGHRLYDQGDVQRVDAILRWIQQGVAVGKVRALLDQGALADEAVLSNEWLEWQTSLVNAAKAFQADKIEQMYQQIFSQYPAQIAVKDWLLPSFEQLGKSAALAFCESIMLEALVARVNQVKNQQKSRLHVLITGLMGQRSLWCYMAAALLMDKGLSCRVVANVQHSDDWSELVAGTKASSVLAFCEQDVASKTTDLLNSMQQWERPVGVVGASVWLAAHEAGATTINGVKVYSDPFDGVMDFMNQVIAVQE